MSLTFPALLQAAAPSGGIASFAPFLFQLGAIFAIFYFIIIRPQQKQKREHENAVMNLKKGDQVVTAGGLVGEVVHVREGTKDGAAAKTFEDHVTIKTGESRVVVERGRVARVVTAPAAAT